MRYIHIYKWRINNFFAFKFPATNVFLRFSQIPKFWFEYPDYIS